MVKRSVVGKFILCKVCMKTFPNTKQYFSHFLNAHLNKKAEISLKKDDTSSNSAFQSEWLIDEELDEKESSKTDKETIEVCNKAILIYYLANVF